MFRGRKVYGSYKVETCPFCNKQGTVRNPQGVTVCIDHQSNLIPDKRCACGEWLELKLGKWGPYFQCINCGNKNFRKFMEGD